MLLPLIPNYWEYKNSLYCLNCFYIHLVAFWIIHLQHMFKCNCTLYYFGIPNQPDKKGCESESENISSTHLSSTNDAYIIYVSMISNIM